MSTSSTPTPPGTPETPHHSTRTASSPTTRHSPRGAYGSPGEFPPSTSIETIVRYIVVERLELTHVSSTQCAHWAQKLSDNLITNLNLLCRISSQRLQKLELPLMLEQELVNIIECAQRGKMRELGGSKVGLVKHSGKRSEHRSALLGLTEVERKNISDSWKVIVEKYGNNLSSVFEQFYAYFFDFDPRARKLFRDTSLEKQSRALCKVVKMLMSTLEDPTAMLPYVQKLGTRHLIYGVTQKDYQSWAIAFTQTLSQCLPDLMTPLLKEAWFVLILKLGQTMTESYDEIISGIKCYVGRINDKEKNKLFCLLTHQCLTIYKDEELTKEMSTVWLKWITDIDVICDEKHTRYFPFCFAISLGDIRFYYGVDTKDDLNWWISELSERVAAHHRVAPDDDEDYSDSSDLANPLTMKQNLNLKKLKKKLKIKFSAVDAKRTTTNT